MDNLTNLSNTIAFIVLNDRSGVILFLQQNGMVFDEQHISNEKLISLIFSGLYEDNNFKKNFLTYLSNNVENNKSFSNAPGDLFSTSRLPTFTAPTSTSTSTSTLGGSSSGGFFSGFNAGTVTSLIGTGLGFLGSSQAGKDQRAIAEANAQAAVANAQSQSQMIQAQLELEKLKLQNQQAQPSTNNNTVLYLVLAVAAVTILGGIIFAVTRKSN